MAQMTEPHYGADFAYEDETAQAEAPVMAGRASGVLGGVAALALIAGVAFWGTELVMRDVSGIPVVRAAKGEMRVAPNDPGGVISDQSGLSVNTIAEGNGAAAPEGTLRLAPDGTGLSDEDQAAGAGVIDTSGETVARGAQDLPTLAGASGESISAETQALVEQIMAEAAPVQGQTAEPVLTASTAAAVPLSAQNPPAQIIPASVPGVALALRPLARPGSIARVSASSGANVAPALASSDGSNGALAPSSAPAVSPQQASYPVGTVMAQLGAYNSPEIAAQEWERFLTLFGPYMTGKTRVIQETSRRGRTLYRLRVARFDDIGGARRFCAAFTSGGAECIAVRQK